MERGKHEAEPNERTEFATSLSNDGGSLEHAALVAVAVGRSGDESPSECGSARMRGFSREGAEFPLSKNFFWVTIGAELRTVIRVISGKDTSLSFGPGAPELNGSRPRGSRARTVGEMRGGRGRGVSGSLGLGSRSGGQARMAGCPFADVKREGRECNYSNGASRWSASEREEGRRPVRSLLPTLTERRMA